MLVHSSAGGVHTFYARDSGTAIQGRVIYGGLPRRGIAGTREPKRQGASRQFGSAGRAGPCLAITADRDTIDPLNQSRLDRLIQTFREADTNGNGNLERDELRALLERVGDGKEPVPMSWLTEADITAVFDRYDKDRNGVISFEEFTEMANDGVFLSGKLSEYKDAFTAFDTSGNGTLGPMEVYTMFEKMAADGFSYDRVVGIFQQYDVDESGEIDFGEFLRMFRNQLIDLKEILTYITTPEQKMEEGVDLAEERRQLTKPGEVSTFFTEQEFQTLVKDNADKVLVVMASLTWCRPCKKISPQLKKMAAEYSNCAFVKFFGNSNEETKEIFKQQLKCRVTPSFYFFRDGALVGSCTGANAVRLEDNLMKYLKPGEGLAQRLFTEPSKGAKIGL